MNEVQGSGEETVMSGGEGTSNGFDGHTVALKVRRPTRLGMFIREVFADYAYFVLYKPAEFVIVTSLDFSEALNERSRRLMQRKLKKAYGQKLRR